MVPTASTLLGGAYIGGTSFHRTVSYHYTCSSVIESTLRTTNNLLERLHASFFFYLLVGTTTFMKIGSYLPAAVLVSTAMLFSGLGEWVRARWTQAPEAPTEKNESNSPAVARIPIRWVSRSRPVAAALLVVASTHCAGVALFYLMTTRWVTSSKQVSDYYDIHGTETKRNPGCISAFVRSIFCPPNECNFAGDQTNPKRYHGTCTHHPQSFQLVSGINCHFNHFCPQFLVRGITGCTPWLTNNTIRANQTSSF